MRLIPVQITASNIPVSVPLRTYIAEKLGSVARSGSDVVGIAMGLRGNGLPGREQFTASALVLLSCRRIYCSSSASTLVGAIDKLARELARLAEQRKRVITDVDAEPAAEPVPSARVADLLRSIDSRVEEILVPTPPLMPQPERSDRSPARVTRCHRSLPRTHRIAVPVKCA